MCVIYDFEVHLVVIRPINENILLRGDFNFYLNPNLDKLKSMSKKMTILYTEMKCVP